MTSHEPLQRHAPRAQPRHRLRTWVKRIALTGAAGAGLAMIVRAWLPSPTLVDIGVASRIALDVELAEDGRTRVRDRFVVSAPTAGNLQRIEREPGAVVAAGDLLARIDPPDPALLDGRSRAEATARLAAVTARHRRADAAVGRATAARDLARKESRRADALAKRGAITGAERERLELEATVADRDVTAAETERAAVAAEIAAVRALLGAGSAGGRQSVAVAAPAGGRILHVLRDSGGPVAAGAPLLELGDPRELEVVVDVLSSEATRIRPAMEVAIEGWGGEPLRGRVRLVEPSGFTRISALGIEEQRVKTVIALDAPPLALGDGFRVDVRIFLWRGAGVLAVPASALFRDRDRWAVYAIEDGRARLRQVELGHRGRNAVEVVRGLAEGTPIVLYPSDRVTDGARIDER
jgi:HlyD family secretion protein